MATLHRAGGRLGSAARSPQRAWSAHGASRTHRAASFAVGTFRSAVAHRLTGHAAETAFYAALALVPATVVVGATLHLIASLGGASLQEDVQRTVISVIRFLIGPKMTDRVVAPFVRTQLGQPDGGATFANIIVGWWLFSHLFTSVGHGLDAAYGVRTQRRSHVRRLIALTCALVSITVLTATVLLMVVLGQARAAWLIALLRPLRWPMLLVILVAALTGLYHVVPSVRRPLRHCVPGALLAVPLLAAAATLFRMYVLFGAADPTGVRARRSDIVLIGHSVGALVGTVFFLYFAAIAVLLGAELNARLYARRGVAALREPGRARRRRRGSAVTSQSRVSVQRRG
jgi:membrane protein